jgi:hypothetical protein
MKEAAALDAEEEAMAIPSKVPTSDAGTCDESLQRVRSFLMGSGLCYFLIFLTTVSGMVYYTTDRFDSNPFLRIDWDEELTVAFVGNAYFFVNDVPRLLRTLSEGRVHQNSCLHAGGSLADLWMTGNGMVNLWQTNEAVVEENYSPYGNADDDNGNGGGAGAGVTIYDYGLCTPAQILQGYDEYIGYGNYAGKYYDDGLNPCIVDQYYAMWVQEQLGDTPPVWDYVVLVDQTKRMAVAEARNSTVNVLINGYGPFLADSGATPVLVDTHAFWSSHSNMTGLSDVPTFTRLIYEGVADYVDALQSVLPRRQAPVVAPVGLAYLLIWEEQFTVWEKLFLDDEIHASIHGSYLFAVVLYATLFGHLPKRDVSVPENVQALFADTRKLLGQGGQQSFPTQEEAAYLRDVARRVVLRGEVPRSFYSSD